MKTQKVGAVQMFVSTPTTRLCARNHAALPVSRLLSSLSTPRVEVSNDGFPFSS